jgi:hypothetical protein
MFVSPSYCNLSQIRFELINLRAEIPWYYNGDNNPFVGNNKNGCGKRCRPETQISSARTTMAGWHFAGPGFAVVTVTRPLTISP